MPTLKQDLNGQKLTNKFLKQDNSNQLHCPTLHVVVDIDIGLRGAHVPVSSQAHEHSHPHAFRGEVRDESSASRMTAATRNACPFVKIMKILG